MREERFPLLPSEFAVDTHISPKDNGSPKGKVTSAGALETHLENFLSSYLSILSDVPFHLTFNLCLKYNIARKGSKNKPSLSYCMNNIPDYWTRLLIYMSYFITLNCGRPVYAQLQIFCTRVISEIQSECWQHVRRRAAQRARASSPHSDYVVLSGTSYVSKYQRNTSTAGRTVPTELWQLSGAI